MGSFSVLDICDNMVILILLLERRSMLLRPSGVMPASAASCFIDNPFFIL